MQWRFPLKLGRVDRPVANNDECNEIEPLLSLYSDGMTSSAEARRVELHLADCQSCRQAHFWMRATYEVISHRPVVMPPPDLASRIQRAIADSQAMPPVPIRMRFNPRPVYGLAATLLVAAVIVPLIHTNHKVSSARVKVASNVPAPAVVLPSEVTGGANTPVVKVPTRKSNAIVHAPVAVASAREEEHPLVHARDAYNERVYTLAVVHHVALPAAHVTLASNRTHSSLPTRKTTVHVSVENLVAANTPPMHEPSVVSRPVAQPQQVAIASPTQPNPIPVVATPAPDIHPVVVAAVEHNRGINDYLREAVQTMRRSSVDDSTVHSFTVAARDPQPQNAFNWVGGTGD